jgi:hypothetical protein
VGGGVVRMSTMAKAAQKIVKQGAEAAPMGVPNRAMKRVMRRGRRKARKLEKQKPARQKAFGSSNAARRLIGGAGRSLGKFSRKTRRRRKKKGEDVVAEINTAPQVEPIDRSTLPMYFVETDQMMEIFSELQDSNLACMQRIAATESAISEREALFAADHIRLDAEYNQLHATYETMSADSERLGLRMEHTKNARDDMLEQAAHAKDTSGRTRRLAEMGYEE